MLSSETAERIVVAALSHPSFGPDRLARLLGEEEVDVSSSQVYRTLRGKGLQTRELRVGFLEEQDRLKKRIDNRESPKVPAPISGPFQQLNKESSDFSASSPALEYGTLSVPAQIEDNLEASAGIVSTWATVPVGSISVKEEKAIPEKAKWLFRGINLLLAFFLVFLGIQIGISFYHEWQNPIAATIPPTEQDWAFKAIETAEPNPIPFYNYRVILDRNLFGSTSPQVPDSAREAAEINAIGIAGSEVGLKLIGTAVRKDRELNYAVVEVTKTRSQEILREKDTVATVLIKRILRNNVIIQTASGEKRLTVNEEPAAGTITPQVQPAVTNNARLPATSKVDGENSEIKVEIPRKEINQFLPEIRQRLEGPNSSTNRPAGRPDGFYLSRVASVDVLYQLGLRTGDVIKSIDGEEVYSLDDAEVLMDRLAEGGEFSIIVERHGKLRSMNLSVN